MSEPTSSDEPKQFNLRGGWVAVLSPTELGLSNVKSGANYTFQRATASADIERFGLTFSQPFFVLRKPRRTTVRVLPEQASVFEEWFGPDYSPELRHQLNNRMRFGIPIGLFYVLTSGLSPVWIALGLLLIVETILARKLPRPSWFLLEALFWAGLLVHFSVRFAKNPDPLSLIFILLNLFFLAFAIKLYRFFRNARYSPPIPRVAQT